MDKLIGETFFGVHKVESNNMHYPFVTNCEPHVQTVAVYIDGGWRIATWEAIEEAAENYELNGDIHRALDILVLRPVDLIKG